MNLHRSSIYIYFFFQNNVVDYHKMNDENKNGIFSPKKIELEDITLHFNTLRFEIRSYY